MFVSPWTPSYVGQTDPVALFSSQQPFRKDPSGCSRVGCTGNGNADDPVNVFTSHITKSQKLLPQLVLGCCLPHYKHLVLVMDVPKERRLYHCQTKQLLLPTGKMISSVSKCFGSVCSSNITFSCCKILITWHVKDLRIQIVDI